MESKQFAGEIFVELVRWVENVQPSNSSPWKDHALKKYCGDFCFLIPDVVVFPEAHPLVSWVPVRKTNLKKPRFTVGWVDANSQFDTRVANWDDWYVGFTGMIHISFTTRKFRPLGVSAGFFQWFLLFIVKVADSSPILFRKQSATDGTKLNLDIEYWWNQGLAAWWKGPNLQPWLFTPEFLKGHKRCFPNLHSCRFRPMAAQALHFTFMVLVRHRPPLGGWKIWRQFCQEKIKKSHK